MRSLLLLLGSLVWLLGCPRAPSRVTTEELVGSYNANFNVATDTLQVRKDGTYVHSWVHNGESIQQEGKWELRQTDHGSRLRLLNFRPSGQLALEIEKGDALLERVAPGMTKSQGESNWQAAVEARGSQVRIVMWSDFGWYYVKNTGQ